MLPPRASEPGRAATFGSVTEKKGGTWSDFGGNYRHTLLKKSSSSSDTTAIASMQYDQALAVEIGPRSGRPPDRILYRI